MTPAYLSTSVSRTLNIIATPLTYSSENVLIPSIVIHEHIWLLTRRFKISFLKVAEKVEQLLSEEHIRLVCEEPSDIAEDGFVPPSLAYHSDESKHYDRRRDAVVVNIIPPVINSKLYNPHAAG